MVVNFKVIALVWCEEIKRQEYRTFGYFERYVDAKLFLESYKERYSSTDVHIIPVEN